jgi:hypothetical protein
MYRHSAALNLGPKANGLLPSPAHEDHSASESESETIAELSRKRRQLDEEIAQFKTQKDKEFRDFELDLRRKRKRKRSPLNGDSHVARTPPTHPSVLSLLGSQPQANGHAQKQNLQQGLRPKTPPPSKPTVSIEKLTIVGSTVPPTTAEASPNILARSLSGITTPPRTQPEKPSGLPPTPNTQNNIKDEPPPTPIARDHNDPFAGVFTPSFLPLLDSRTSSTNSIAQEKSVEQSERTLTPQPTPGSESTSLPSSSISPRIPGPQKRSVTTPILPSTNSSSLPSALRVVSADAPNTRKRKHVTFRLADSAVVEPSSSYEEMSSPDLPPPSESSKGKVKVNGIDDVLNKEEVPWSWSKGQTSPAVEKDDAMGMSLAGDGESDDSGPDMYMSTSTNLSSTGDTSENDLIPIPAPAPRGLQFEEAEDGGSGVGFFELEEELSPSISPRLRSPRNDRARFFEDWGALPDEDDEDAEMKDQDQTGEQEDIAREMEDVSEEEPQGLGISTGAAERQEGSTFTSGSVPIDIVVRPSSSWVGSFGTGSFRESEYVP